MRPLIALVALSLLTTSPALAAPTRDAADSPAKMRSVVREWSTRLNANDNAGAARLFALPALLTQGPYAYRLKTYKQLALWHDGLPCAGKVTRIIVNGRFATAVFTLGKRKATRATRRAAMPRRDSRSSAARSAAGPRSRSRLPPARSPSGTPGSGSRSGSRHPTASAGSRAPGSHRRPSASARHGAGSRS